MQRVFCAERTRNLSKGNICYNWNKDGDPIPGRKVRIVEKMNLLCGGPTVIQYKSKDLAWSELKRSHIKGKVPSGYEKGRVKH